MSEESDDKPVEGEGAETEAAQTEAAETKAGDLGGARVWLVTDGTAESAGWLDPLVQSLRDTGAGTVDVLGVSGVLGFTARGILEQGADKIARTLRLSRKGESDSNAIEALERARPDVVLVDQPALLRTLEVVRQATSAAPIHIGLISTYDAPTEWEPARSDAFIAPEPMQLDPLRRPGMSDSALRAAGPPLPPGFDRALDRAAIRQDFGYTDDDTVVLIDTSTMTARLIDAVVFQISVVKEPIEVLFYYGRNLDAADVLRQSSAAHGLKANMFGHLDALEEYFVIADMVVIGAANPLVPCYLALHRPLLAIDPSAHTSVPSRAGALVALHDATDLAVILEEIAVQGVPEGHIESAVRMGHPQGTKEVADAVAAVWAARETLTERIQPPPPSAPVETGRGSRFETIGDAPASAPARNLAPLSKAAAKEQLAALIMEERKLDGELSDLTRQRDKWLGRLELAEESGETDLADMARERTGVLTDDIARLNDRRTAIADQKDIIRQRVASSGRQLREQARDERSVGSDYERRFRELEMGRDMRRLRKRASGKE